MNRTSTLHRLRTAGIGLCLGGVAISAWSSAISVRAANSGDIFIQSAGAGAPSGHATDPHLSCADIDLWGAGLADPSSTFTIAGAPPSGSDETVYSASWSYSSAVADPQIIAVVPVALACLAYIATTGPQFRKTAIAGVVTIATVGALVWGLVFSPDGRRIAFTSGRLSRLGSYEIWVCDSDGSNALQLTSLGAEACWPIAGRPRWPRIEACCRRDHSRRGPPPRPRA